MLRDKATCQHSNWSWHAPKRNKKTCMDCTSERDMSAHECWVHREEFEEPWQKLGE